tara:strand:- start:1402 stop:1620 length:219 start_codon:yes stop_codon:yes gene_type:complete
VEEIKVGSLILDINRIGIVVNIYKAGTMDIELPLIKWRRNYLIYYQDGTTMVMGEPTIERLLEEGKLKILRS